MLFFHSKCNHIPRTFTLPLLISRREEWERKGAFLCFVVGAVAEVCTENCPKGSWVCCLLLTSPAHTPALFQEEGWRALQYLPYET